MLSPRRGRAGHRGRPVLAALAAALAAAALLPAAASAYAPAAITGSSWSDGSAECMYMGGRKVKVYPPMPEVRPSTAGYMYYWHSTLVTWDGNTNTWLQSVEGRDNSTGNYWSSSVGPITLDNWNQGWFPQLQGSGSSGYQTFYMSSRSNMYTAVYVRTAYVINGQTYYGPSKWVKNGTELAEGSYNGWCWWH